MFSTTTLGELIASRGGSIKTGPFGTLLKAAEYSSATGVPLISVGEIGDGVLQVGHKTPRVDRDVISRLPEYVLRSGDIVFGRKGAVDRSAWLSSEQDGYFLGSDGIRVRFDCRVSSRFMAYQFRLETVRQWLVQHSAGTTMPSMNQKILEQLPVQVPPQPLQQAIAEILGAFDDKIAANDRIAYFTDELLAETFAHMSNTVSSGKLSEIARINVETKRPEADGHLVYLDISAISIGRYQLPSPISWSKAPGRARRVVRSGDTIWSTVRPNRRSHALVLEESEELIASTGLAVISPNAGRIAGVYESSRTDLFVQYLESVAEGSAYPAVRSERFLDAPIPHLTAELWDQFESIALPMRLRVAAALRENRALSAMRDELLPLLMSGRIHVRDAEMMVEEVI